MGQAGNISKYQSDRFNGAKLSTTVFDALSRYVTDELGIKMPDSKRTMLQSRLQKRLRILALPSFEAYYDYIFSEEGQSQELHHFLDAVTTNKTDFFREPRHYSVLVDHILPDLMNGSKIGEIRPLKIWSAGCSTGAEPYTLAMVLEDFSEKSGGFQYRIIATDICTRVLSIAKAAIYEEKEAAPIPLSFKKKYLLRSKDRSRPRIRVVPDLRRMVEFRRLNFMDSDYAMSNAIDIIMCRNVIIYFDRPTQFKVLQKLCRDLHPGGFLFMGHSETLNGFNLPLQQVTANVYRKT